MERSSLMLDESSNTEIEFLFWGSDGWIVRITKPGNDDLNFTPEQFIRLLDWGEQNRATIAERGKPYQVAPGTSSGIMSKEIETMARSIAEMVATGEAELRMLAESGNALAARWQVWLQATQDTIIKAALIGNLRMALLQNRTLEAQEIVARLFPEQW